MATLGIPGYGYGIRYRFGIFEQEIKDGNQVERPDPWLRYGDPWSLVRPEYAVRVGFGGRVLEGIDVDGKYRALWVDTKQVLGIPYDTPIAGYGNDTVNTLRLWEAHTDTEFDLQMFNDGDYVRAVEEKNQTEVISKVLYPNDSHQTGRDLRLKQEYFFVACAIHDIVRRYRKRHATFDAFADKNAIQLNDTHPSLAVVELMRVFVDEHGVAWESAWEIVNASVGYTNHTILEEALERWPVAMFERLLPRHLQIIYEINRRFLSMVAKSPGDVSRVQRLSLIDETGGGKKVRMANLAVVGSHSVNGVAQLHTELLKQGVFLDFADLYPERFSNKTNGVTPRRWLLQCNPRLAKAITHAIGPGWTRDLDRLELLEPLAKDAAFVEQIGAIKLANKRDFTAYARDRFGFVLDPESLFDVQVKRLHEYKRQLLNALHVVRLYLDAKNDPGALGVPRTVLFGAKAAPGYRMAKLIIKLIHSIASTVNRDVQVGARLKVAFVPDYKVSLAERIFPASDLSEQISTAGTEASGTGNMKFAMNGALTIGTLDGANIEIRDAVGAENFFLFGLTAEEVARRKSSGYVPRRVYEENADLREVLDAVASGMFEPGNKGLFQPLVDSLLNADPYMLLVDYASYVACQKRVAEAYRDPSRWHAMAVRNIAKMGHFSSDRTVRDYARDNLEGAASEPHARAP
jgi:starch phosphorylase